MPRKEFLPLMLFNGKILLYIFPVLFERATASKVYICKKLVNPLPQMNSVVNGICPKLNTNNTKLLWIDLDKRSQYCYWFSVSHVSMPFVSPTSLSKVSSKSSLEGPSGGKQAVILIGVIVLIAFLR
jgi:hypothetical protein